VKVLGPVRSEDSYALLVHEDEDDSPVYWISVSSDTEQEDHGLRWRITIREDGVQPVTSEYFPESVVAFLLQALSVMRKDALAVPEGLFEGSSASDSVVPFSELSESDFRKRVEEAVRARTVGRYMVGGRLVEVTDPDWNPVHYLSALRGDSASLFLLDTEDIVRRSWEEPPYPEQLTAEILKVVSLLREEVSWGRS